MSNCRIFRLDHENSCARLLFDMLSVYVPFYDVTKCYTYSPEHKNSGTELWLELFICNMIL
jgi:hypothetical protein